MKKSRTKNIVYFSVYFFLFITFVFSFLHELWSIFFFSILSIIAIFLLRFFIRRSNVRYPIIIEVALVLFVGLSFMIDELKLMHNNIYGLIFVKHMLGGMLFGVIAFMLVYVLNNFHKASLNLKPFFIGLFSFSFAIAFSFLWLVFEGIFNVLFTQNEVCVNSTSQLWTTVGVFGGSLLVAVAGYQYVNTGKFNIVGRLLDIFFKDNPAYRANIGNLSLDSTNLIEGGEGEYVEFKETLRMNLHTFKRDARIEHAVFKTICAFLNTDGGVLFIGVKDNGVISGLKSDEFENNDKFQLHFINLFNKYIGEIFVKFIKTDFVKVKGKDIFRVECFNADTPVFLKYNNTEEFFVRIGASSKELKGSDLVKYINDKF